MEKFETLIQNLNDKLDIQNRELNSIKSQLEKAKKTPKNMNKNRFKSHRNYERDGYYKEYSYTERVYLPDVGYKAAPLQQRTRDDYSSYSYFNGPEYFPQRFVPDNYLTQPKKDENPKKTWYKRPPVNAAVLKLRQNHLPFVIDKAKQERQCRSCRKPVAKDSTVIIHKEIVAYAHYKYGWDKPIYSKDPIAQFYHFKKACIKSRGFEDAYLSLCYVEVGFELGEEERTIVRNCGFRRPIRKKHDKCDMPLVKVAEVTATAADVTQLPREEVDIIEPNEMIGEDDRLVDEEEKELFTLSDESSISNKEMERESSLFSDKLANVNKEDCSSEPDFDFCD